MVKRFRIGLLMHYPQWMGGIIYIQNLVKALNFLPPEERQTIEIYLLVGSDIKQEFYKDLVPIVDKVCIEDCLTTNLYNRLSRKIGQFFPIVRNVINRSLVQVVNREQLDFVYPVNIFGISWNFSCDYATWIPDFQYKYFPQFFKKTSNLNKIYADVASKSDKIVLSSKVAEKDFHKFFPNSTAKTFVLNFRTIIQEDCFDCETKVVIKKYNLPDHFFLVSNQFWIHKNHRLVFESLEILKIKYNILPNVVCTGSLYEFRSPSYIKKLLQYIQESGLQNQIKILGLIPRNDQIQLMRQCLAVIQPSLFEGWSTVVEDARSLGKTLILSEIPVHLEQNPPQTIFFDPNSAEDLADKITMLLPKLSPGPNFQLEIKTKKNNLKNYQIFAEDFIKIVKDEQCSTSQKK